MLRKLSIINRKDLNLEKDEEIVRCRGRLKNVLMEYNAKYQIILLKNSEFMELVAQYYHKLVSHNGVRETLNQIRTIFWITKPRNYIRRIIEKCFIFNLHKGSPFQYPAPPDLPLYTLSDKVAFTYSAVDYAD